MSIVSFSPPETFTLFSLSYADLLSSKSSHLESPIRPRDKFSGLTPILGVYFDILLALDGSEFNAELVCQGEVMGRCTARFK